MDTREVSLAGVNAALYAAVGYMTYLGIFAPIFGVVRFWPSVVIPASFSAVFGPTVGGLGAAVGIFVSDMLIHGNALLSLIVGVPANFLGFYTMGWIYNRIKGENQLAAAITVQILPLTASGTIWFLTQDPVAAAYAIACGISTILIVLVGRWRGRWVDFFLAGSIGLMLGSAVIGAGVWTFSQFFVLPTGESNLPAAAAALWFLWTYSSEIPFIILLGPPLVKVLETAR